MSICENPVAGDRNGQPLLTGSHNRSGGVGIGGIRSHRPGNFRPNDRGRQHLALSA
ncbi:hypothetical protein DPMN_046855 [Dreissena polymorpha]|uniref:Uncharacterized protein n=1 Tax=Dreissena polymorpha TaxID=45954 RepID=A0A9D4D7P0_DREPO|nr:hypothetical protein DPMN_046855 [Dreissena polymorpha]